MIAGQVVAQVEESVRVLEQGRAKVSVQVQALVQAQVQVQVQVQV